MQKGSLSPRVLPNGTQGNLNPICTCTSVIQKGSLSPRVLPMVPRQSQSYMYISNAEGGHCHPGYSQWYRGNHKRTLTYMYMYMYIGLRLPGYHWVFSKWQWPLQPRLQLETYFLCRCITDQFSSKWGKWSDSDSECRASPAYWVGEKGEWVGWGGVGWGGGGVGGVYILHGYPKCIQQVVHVYCTLDILHNRILMTAGMSWMEMFGILGNSPSVTPSIGCARYNTHQSFHMHL